VTRNEVVLSTSERFITILKKHDHSLMKVEELNAQFILTFSIIVTRKPDFKNGYKVIAEASKKKYAKI